MGMGGGEGTEVGNGGRKGRLEYMGMGKDGDGLNIWGRKAGNGGINGSLVVWEGNGGKMGIQMRVNYHSLHSIHTYIHIHIYVHT